jgi:hypothetical protein
VPAIAERTAIGSSQSCTAEFFTRISRAEMNILWMNTGERIFFSGGVAKKVDTTLPGLGAYDECPPGGTTRRARAASAPEKRKFRRNPNGDRGLSADE